MNFFNRLGNGWKLGMASLRVIRENKQLVMFPIISGLVLLIVLASFLGGMLVGYSFDLGTAVEQSGPFEYTMAFLFYLASYFIIVFFNMGLVHCTRIYLDGGKPTFSDGIQFSSKRIHIILGWATLSATVGIILKAVEENSGTVGDIIAGIIGAAWSVMTFFVVPVLAYENVGPIDAVKRSTSIMRNKWGESIGASFSFSIMTLAGILIIALPIGLVLGMLNPVVGIAAGIMLALLIQSIVSAAEMVFISSVYHVLVDDQPVDFIDNDTLDGMFMERKKKGLF